MNLDKVWYFLVWVGFFQCLFVPSVHIFIFLIMGYIEDLVSAAHEPMC